MTITPPADLAPRIHSMDPAAFPVPHGREEEWRFTPLADFADLMEPIADAPSVRATDGAHVLTLPIDEIDSTWTPSDRPTAVARRHASTAVVVTIANEEELSEPIHVDLTAPRLAYEHVEIRAGAHSKATVVLQQPSAGAVGAIVVTLADGARLDVVNVCDSDREARILLTWHARIGRDAQYRGTQVSLGARRLRVLPTVEYLAPGGSADLQGVFLADEGQFMEHRIFVDHDTPHCRSNVVYKGALAGSDTHTVWVGDVLVRREATAIETYEINRNLLLDEGPRADSVPNLELETGDVISAGHASATGRFDDDQLFYLQARGIDEETARQLVVRGFFAEVVARIDDQQWRDDIMTRIQARLGMSSDMNSAGEDDDE